MFRKLIEDFPIIHSSVGLAGNTMFFAGSILFLEMFKDIRPIGVWLFIVGAFFMLLGALGDWLLKHWNYETRKLSVKEKSSDKQASQIGAARSSAPG